MRWSHLLARPAPPKQRSMPALMSSGLRVAGPKLGAAPGLPSARAQLQALVHSPATQQLALVPQLARAEPLALALQLVHLRRRAAPGPPPARPLQPAPGRAPAMQSRAAYNLCLARERPRRAHGWPPGQPSRRRSPKVQTSLLLLRSILRPWMQLPQRRRLRRQPARPSRLHRRSARQPCRRGRPAGAGGTCTPLCWSSPGCVR